MSLGDKPTILVSRCDKHILGLGWRIGSNGYAYLRHRKEGKPCLMHRIILGVKGGKEVHHKNGNKLDNRRCNLEITTASEHQKHHSARIVEMNKARRKHSSFRKCGFCGDVFYRKWMIRTRKFCSISCGIKNRHRELGHKISEVI